MWDEESKKMEYEPKYTIEEEADNYSLNALFSELKKGVILMEWTGISFNGSKCFENDIITNAGDKFEVVWNQPTLSWWAKGIGCEDLSLCELQGTASTFVVGDRYSKPELLK